MRLIRSMFASMKLLLIAMMATVAGTSPPPVPDFAGIVRELDRQCKAAWLRKAVAEMLAAARSGGVAGRAAPRAS